ncbi:MAG: phosphoribosyl-ATP diphosphatase [Caldilineaceae bacterium]
MSNTIQKLYETIQQRKQNPPPGSYTATLFAAGENEILKKMGEEAIEVIIAAKGEGDDRVIYELADFFYHSLVLLAEREIEWSDVEAELSRRMK